MQAVSQHAPMRERHRLVGGGVAAAVSSRAPAARQDEDVEIADRRLRAFAWLHALSLNRPAALPSSAPRGAAARELPSDRYQDHPGVGLTPQRVVQIYREAEFGYPRVQCDLFDDVVENDCHLRNLFEQRQQAVSDKDWVMQPAEGDASTEGALAAQVLQAALRRLPMMEVWEHQLGFNRYGWGASEMDWDIARIDGRDWIVPVWFANVPANRFKIDKRDQLRLVVDQLGGDGEELAAGKWLVTRRSGGLLARVALMRTATWMALFKRHGSADWFLYAKKYGLPLTLVKYPLEGDETSKDVAVEAVENLSEDGGAILPKDFDIEIFGEGRTGDSSGTHGGLINFCNREMSKLINGSTLSNDNGDSGGASYALGDVHNSLRFEAVEYDAKRLQESFRTQVAAAFVRFNGLPCEAPQLLFQIARDQAPERVVNMADAVVNKLRLPISAAQMRHATGFRAPIDAADTIAPAPPTAPAAPVGGDQ